MNNFGNFLYMLRKEKGLTQAELAEMLGVSNKAVSKWETGDAMPETAQLLPISRIFGVSVDELLRGERIAADAADAAEPVGDKSVGDKDKDFDKEYDEDEDDEDDEDGDAKIEGHLFKRGKDETLLEKISGAICGVVMLLGLAAYLAVGFTVKWHPFWAIVVDCGLLCGMISCVFELCDGRKREKKLAHGKNPYTGAACGLIMLTCAAVYITVSAFTGLWHPLWAIVAGGGLSCAITAIIGNVFVKKAK